MYSASVLSVGKMARDQRINAVVSLITHGMYFKKGTKDNLPYIGYNDL